MREKETEERNRGRVEEETGITGADVKIRRRRCVKDRSEGERRKNNKGQ